MNLITICRRDINLGNELEDATAGCNAKDDTGAICGETYSLEILKLFNEFYANRLKRVEGDSEVVQQTLQCWIQDLTQQNTLLVDTVKKLEQDIVDQFSSMASGTQGEVSRRNNSSQTESQSCFQCTASQTVNEARTCSAQTDCALPECPDQLSQVEHFRAKLSRAELFQPVLSRSELSGTELSPSELSRPEISRCELSRTDLSRRELLRPELSRSELSRPELSRLDLARPELSRPELSRPQFSRPELSRPELSRPQLSRPELSRSELSRPELSRSERSQAELSRAAPQPCSQCAAYQRIIEARTSAQTGKALLECPDSSWLSQLKALQLSRPSRAAETQTDQLFSPISAFRSVPPTSLFRPIPSTPFSITLTRGTQTKDRGQSSMSRPTQTLSTQTLSQHVQTEGERTAILAGSRLRVDKHSQTIVEAADAAIETGPDPVRTQLAEVLKRNEGLHTLLRDSHKASHDTQEALTLEVAQKHDQILALKKDVQQLEERLLHADKQTHFKDDIIREMRKQLKMASSKLLFLNLVDKAENQETIPEKVPKPPRKKKRKSASCQDPKISAERSQKQAEGRIRVDECGDRRCRDIESVLVRGGLRKRPRSKFTLLQSSILELRILDCLREELTARIQQC